MSIRRAAAAALALLLAAAGVFVALAGGPAPEAAVLPAAHRALLDSYAPSERVDSSLLTPPGDRWWRLVTGLDGSLRLEKVAAPQDAAWYALTTQATRDAMPTPYGAVHVGFTDESAASAWAARQSATVTDSGARVVPWRRGPVVTLLPPWVDVTAEPYTSPERMPTPLQSSPVAGSWQMSWSVHADLVTLAKPEWGSAYQTTIRALGATGSTAAWWATAPDPEAEWDGSTVGFDAGAVDLAVVAMEANATAVDVCDDAGVCTRVSGGLGEAARYANLGSATGHGFGTMPDPDAGEGVEVSVPADVAWAGWVDPHGWRAAATAQPDPYAAGVSALRMSLSTAGELTVRPVLRD